MSNRLLTDWVVVSGAHHLFAGHREGLISICGEQRHPKQWAKKPGDSSLFCFFCMQHLRIILNPEKFAPTKGTRIWQKGASDTR